jgi:hypothetical protein
MQWEDAYNVTVEPPTIRTILLKLIQGIGWYGSHLCYVQRPPEIRTEDHKPIKCSKVPHLPLLGLARCLGPRARCVRALAPYLRGVRW